MIVTWSLRIWSNERRNLLIFSNFIKGIYENGVPKLTSKVLYLNWRIIFLQHSLYGTWYIVCILWLLYIILKDWLLVCYYLYFWTNMLLIKVQFCYRCGRLCSYVCILMAGAWDWYNKNRTFLHLRHLKWMPISQFWTSAVFVH